jgi:hypothetical protein
LVEAYAADGWRGASREKVKPLAEIKRAKEQINKCKDIIKECVRVCDEAEGDVPIDKTLFDEDGELDLEHIFCSKCRGQECDDVRLLSFLDFSPSFHLSCLFPFLPYTWLIILDIF